MKWILSSTDLDIPLLIVDGNTDLKNPSGQQAVPERSDDTSVGAFKGRSSVGLPFFDGNAVQVRGTRTSMSSTAWSAPEAVHVRSLQRLEDLRVLTDAQTSTIARRRIRSTVTRQAVRHGLWRLLTRFGLSATPERRKGACEARGQIAGCICGYDRGSFAMSVKAT
jgi:hypothetical protein